MEEFESYKAEQFESVMDEIKKAKKREEFTEILNKLTPEQKKSGFDFTLTNANQIRIMKRLVFALN